MNPDLAHAPCPCGSAKAYSVCCGRFLEHAQQPDTAEALMRSRYSAYVLVREDYLLRTWHESTRPHQIDFSDAAKTKWLDLKIIRTEAGGPSDQHGVVEFAARYKVGGKAERMVETSRFIRENGCWLYRDGVLPAEAKPNRR